jgi:hypothetical protein
MSNAQPTNAVVAEYRPPGAPAGDTAEVEYLLRRFKGAYYRRRHPNISLRGAE